MQMNIILRTVFLFKYNNENYFGIIGIYQRIFFVINLNVIS